MSAAHTRTVEPTLQLVESALPPTDPSLVPPQPLRPMRWQRSEDEYGPDWLDLLRARMAAALREFLLHPLMDRIEQFAYLRSIWINVVFAIAVLILCNVLNPGMLHGSVPVSGLLGSLLVLISLLQACVCALSHVAMVRELAFQEKLKPWAIWNMYMR